MSRVRRARIGERNGGSEIGGRGAVCEVKERAAESGDRGSESEER